MIVTTEELIQKSAKKRMLGLKRQDNQWIVEMNFSSLAIIQECLRKAKYRLIDELSNEDDSEAQIFGKAIHKALEHWYMLPEEYRQLTDSELKTVDSVIGGLIPEGPYPTALDSIFEFVKTAEPLRFLGDDDKRSMANGIKILKAYFKHYANDGMEVLRDSDGQPMVEKQVEGVLYDTPELKIIFHGQIDLVLRNKITGQVHISDHKTTASLGKDFYNRISPNHQYTGYVWAANNLLGIKTDSFIVNGIQVAKTKSEFARQVTTITEDDYSEMLMAYVEAAKRLIHAETHMRYPMTSPNPCAAYGGCQYLDICQAPLVLRTNIIQAKYEKST